MTNVVGSFEFGFRNAQNKVIKMIDEGRNELLQKIAKLHEENTVQSKLTADILEEVDFVLREFKEDVKGIKPND